MMNRPIFIANWKMNMLSRDAAQYVLEFRRLYKPADSGLDDTVLAPPFTLLSAMREQIGGLPGVLLAGQNVHWDDVGPHTGEIAAPMLRELGVSFAIVGHSERRQFYGETDRNVSKRALNALKHGIRPVVCVGETLSEFEAGKTNEVLKRQLEAGLENINSEQIKQAVLAYEPVWAIGTGRAATAPAIESANQFVIDWLIGKFGAEAEKTKILYGGSTTADNIADIIKVPGVGGALVGGASLSPVNFWNLIERGRAAASPVAS